MLMYYISCDEFSVPPVYLKGILEVEGLEDIEWHSLTLIKVRLFFFTFTGANHKQETNNYREPEGA